jgi:phospholipase/carboxylesterase
VKTVASLSGFLPDGLDMITARNSFSEKPIFLAHGSRDELVPIERARSAVDILGKAGGNVTYCEDDVGHKLSASCFRGLEGFLAGQECS